MKKQINPLWAGIAIAAIVVIALGIDFGSLKFLSQPITIMILVVLLLGVSYIIYGIENTTRIGRFLHRTHLDYIIGAIALAGLIIEVILTLLK